MLQPISYHDRDGFVVERNNELYRYVHFSYADTYNHFINSGLYQRLIDDGLLISHREETMSYEEQQMYCKILVPEKIVTLTLPAEWTPTQWKEVVICYLKISMIAIEYNIILKDATPYNFSFYKGNCILFDTLSFEKYIAGQPWIAYRQFCETMLGPLSLICYNSPLWGKLFTSSAPGWSLSFISKQLPVRSYFSLSILFHIHWHSHFSNKDFHKSSMKKNTLDQQKLKIMWNLIQRSVLRWRAPSVSTNWMGYYENEIEAPDYLQQKKETVARWLTKFHARTVIDVGANKGLFSILAASVVKEVIAIEPDIDCMEELYRVITDEHISNIQIIVADLADPTPANGWMNKEHPSLLQRISCDTLMSLALIHHLCITRNLPLSFIAEQFSILATHRAIVEFVPKTDSKVQSMLENRKDIFDDYSESHFITAFSCYFTLEETYCFSNSSRKLFLWIKK